MPRITDSVAGVLRKAAGALESSPGFQDGAAPVPVSHQDLAEQALGIVMAEMPGQGMDGQILNPEQDALDNRLREIVEERLKIRAPAVGMVDGVHVANGTKTREEATTRPTQREQELAVHYMTALKDMATPEFQENITRVAKLAGIKREELVVKVDNLVAIMACPPPALLEATDFPRSHLQAGTTGSEQKLIETYVSLRIAQQGYNLGLYVADDEVRHALTIRLTPEEQLAMQVTADEGLGIWRPPARTPDSVANVVSAAPIHAQHGYLNIVHELADEVARTHEFLDWEDSTEGHCAEVSRLTVGRVIDAMYRGQYHYVESLRQVSMSQPPVQPKRGFWSRKEQQQPVMLDQIAYAIMGRKAIENLRGNSLATGISTYLGDQHYEGKLAYWDHSTGRPIAHAYAPIVPPGDERAAKQIFREVVIPHAFANGAGSEQVVKSAQSLVALGEKLDDMVEAHKEANPIATQARVAGVLEVINHTDAGTSKKAAALAAMKRGDEARRLAQQIEQDPQQREERDPNVRRQNPPVLGR